MRAYTPAGSRRRTCSTRLARSKISRQSSVAQKRRLVKMFATEICSVACRWVSSRMSSSTVRPWRASRSSSATRSGADRRSVLAQALHELHHERDVDVSGSSGGGRLPSSRRSPQKRDRVPGLAAAATSSVRQLAEAGQECELQDARPRPELADPERSASLEGGEVAGDAHHLEPAVAVPEEIVGEELDAGPVVAGGVRHAGGGDGSRAAGRGGRSAPPPRPCGSCRAATHRRGQRLTAVHVGGGRAIGGAQPLRVLVESCEMAPAPAASRQPRIVPGPSSSGERARTLLELLQAEELGRGTSAGARRGRPDGPRQSDRRSSLLDSRTLAERPRG